MKKPVKSNKKEKVDSGTTLSLRICKNSILDIISGEKKEEFRNISKYYECRIGKFINDKFVFNNIKSLHLYCGNEKDSLFCDIEVTEINIDLFENDFYAKYTNSSDEFKKGDCTFTFTLGSIINTNINN